MVQDLFVKKNSIFDKTGNFEGIFSKLLGSSFLFSKADELWKAKRKACAHAFYKERLVIMIETLKDKLEEDCKLWTKQAKSHYYKSKEVDFSVVLNELFTRNILHIAFGEDISKEKINIMVAADMPDTSGAMSEKEVTFGDAIQLIFKQLLFTIRNKA